MSDTNRVGVRYVKNNATAFPIAGALSLTALRYTGVPNFGLQPQNVVSAEIRSDRQVVDSILVGAQAGGSVNFEMSYGAFDDLIESAMMSTWVTTPTKVGTSEITGFGAGTVTVDDDADFADDLIVRLEKLNAGAAGDGIYVVASSAANVITLTPYDSNTNAITGSFAADADTKLQVCGYRAGANAEIQATVASGVATLTASGSSSFANLMGSANRLDDGQWIKISGFATAENNVWARITGGTTTTITFAAPTGFANDTATGVQVEIFFGDYVRNGTDNVTSHQYVIERRFEDHSPVTREAFLGMSVNTFSIQLPVQNIVTGSIAFQGFTAQVEDATVTNLYTAGAPTDVEAEANTVYNTSNQIGRLGRGIDLVKEGNKNYVLDATIELTNNMNPRGAVGEFGAIGTRVGEVGVTGRLNTYFDDKELLSQQIANGETSFDISMIGGDGRAVLFDLPRIKFGEGAPEVAGKNQDVTIPLSYTAIRDATLTYTIHAQRFPFAA